MIPQCPVIALTCGDVAGIGPEIVVKAVSDAAIRKIADCVILGHPEIVQRAIQLWCPQLNLLIIDEPTERDELENSLQEARQTASDADRPTVVCLNDSSLDVIDAAAGQVSSAAGDAAFRYLTTAIRLAQNGIVDAIATAPLNKEALQAAGHHFPGHTEILADRCSVTEFAMMLHLPESAVSPLRRLIKGASDSVEPAGAQSGSSTDSLGCGVSVAHVTLHTSIASVPELLTSQNIFQTTELMNGFLKSIGCERSAIAVTALNPHGGENGLFGSEEADTIRPAVVRAQRSGMNVLGPLPVDTLIRRAVTGEFDGVVAMYHDQGHIPVKLLGFDSAINITLGLPIIRTSPTHGTAFDKAWNAAGLADAAGMVESIRMACKLVAGKHG